MPSGARKRKAAKKKKILEANNANPNEHDDSKSQDDKGSDGSEVSSPAQQDHNNNNNHPFSKGDPSGVRSIAPENSDSIEKENQGEKVTEIEWSLKPEKDDEDGSSSSRSSSNSSRSSSSDDENSGAAADKTKEEKKVKEPSEVVVSVEAVPETSMENCDAVADLSPAPAIESVQLSVPISEETINVVESTLVLSSGDDPKGFPVSDAHVAQPSNADSKIPPIHENQASVGVHPVHKTPWWSCCGMFDVVSGSR